MFEFLNVAAVLLTSEVRKSSAAENLSAVDLFFFWSLSADKTNGLQIPENLFAELAILIWKSSLSADGTKGRGQNAGSQLTDCTICVKSRRKKELCSLKGASCSTFPESPKMCSLKYYT